MANKRIKLVRNRRKYQLRCQERSNSTQQHWQRDLCYCGRQTRQSHYYCPTS